MEIILALFVAFLVYCVVLLDRLACVLERIVKAFVNIRFGDLPASESGFLDTENDIR